MKYTLKTPIEIETKDKEFIRASEIEVIIKGERGGMMVKKVQGIIVEGVSNFTVSEVGKLAMDMQKEREDRLIKQLDKEKENAKTVKEPAQKEVAEENDKMTKEDIEDALIRLKRMVKEEKIYPSLMAIIKKYGRIAGYSLCDAYIDQMVYEDIDGLCDDILRFFFIKHDYLV